MKKYLVIMIILITALVSMSCSIGTAQSSSPQNLPQASLSTRSSSVSFSENSTEITPVSDLSGLNSVLSAGEIEGLAYMREEEKLAHDLYLFFYEKWGLPVFDNIAQSELTHMESVAFLLDRYGIPDPAADNPAGVFTNTALQDLYDQLSAKGSQSTGDALKAGALVEEVDILDLREEIAATSQVDILQVYENLEMGSNNHLQAFVSVLQNQTGESYVPLYLGLDDFQQIISSGMQSNGLGQGAGSGQGGRRNN